ncbi:MAG TPA: response regulator, partial [Candidatus Binatia bacterium]|nr:response regulator [Candidatus Binatia bacterium]
MSSESRLLAGPIAANILVIDDEVQLRDLLKTVLSEHGYGVETAEDGHQAIEKVKAARFDLALCDLVMPGIDGIETIARIREIRPDIQLIVMTAHGSYQSAVESLRAGVFDFLAKPLLLKDLLFSVRRALERSELLERLALYELSRSIFSTLDPGDLYGRIVRAAVDVLRADDASLMLLDENRELHFA